MSETQTQKGENDSSKQGMKDSIDQLLQEAVKQRHMT